MKRRRSIFDIMYEYLEEFEQASEEMFEGILEKPSWDIEAHSLEPLFDVHMNSDRVMITADLPYVDSESLEINEVREGVIEISAKMKIKVNFEDLGITHRKGEFSCFHCRVPMPVPVEAKLAKAQFIRGILVVVLPRKRGDLIKLE